MKLDKYEDALSIFNSLSKEERYFLANDYFDDNPCVKYRKVLKENKNKKEIRLEKEFKK